MDLKTPWKLRFSKIIKSSLTPRSVTLCRVRLSTVLACTELNFSQISRGWVPDCSGRGLWFESGIPPGGGHLTL